MTDITLHFTFIYTLPLFWGDMKKQTLMFFKSDELLFILVNTIFCYFSIYTMMFCHNYFTRSFKWIFFYFQLTEEKAVFDKH